MTSMPLLSVHNCVAVLFIDEIPESNMTPLNDLNKMKVIFNTQSPPLKPLHYLKWKKCLPKYYVVVVNMPGQGQCRAQDSICKYNEHLYMPCKTDAKSRYGY